MLQFIKSSGLEGGVAKGSDSVYQPGQWTGMWSKFRINLGQEFVVGSYIPSRPGVDSLVVKYWGQAGFTRTNTISTQEQQEFPLGSKWP